MNVREMTEFVNKELGMRYGNTSAILPMSLKSQPKQVVFPALQRKPRPSLSTPEVDKFLTPPPALPAAPLDVMSMLNQSAPAATAPSGVGVSPTAPAAPMPAADPALAGAMPAPTPPADPASSDDILSLLNL